MGSVNLKHSLFNSLRKLMRFYPFEKFLAVLSQNKKPESFVARLLPENKFYTPGSIRNVTRNGIKYSLDISDYQEWLVYFGIDNDDCSHGLFNLIKPEQTVIDVGANVGQTALPLAKIVGTKGKVIAYEADPGNFERLKKNIQLNDFNNIKIFATGVGAKEEVLPMKISSNQNRGGNRIDRKNELQTNTFITIQPLDKLIPELGLTRLDVIKIDVEGFEMEVLKGAKEVISNYQPNLFIELNDQNLKAQGAQPLDLVQYLESAGYQINHAKTGKRISFQDNFLNCHFDIVGIKSNE